MISEELENFEKKVLNIKMYEKDFVLIKIAIVSEIQKLNKSLNEIELDDLTRLKFESNIINYKKLLSKLETCKLYNEDN